MKKIVLATAILAAATLPVSANAAQCRNKDTGKFAKCGTVGAIPASQYVAKGQAKPKPGTMSGSAMMATRPATPPATPAKKPSLMSRMMMKKATTKPTTAPAAH